jgi:hypothetical protein
MCWRWYVKDEDKNRYEDKNITKIGTYYDLKNSALNIYLKTM